MPAVVVLVAIILVLGFLLMRRSATLPAPGSEAYVETTRSFYHGLAALEVGLLDDARQQFTRATMLIPDEPASWANLGLAQMRLGELDAAAQPIERALTLAPMDPDILLLAGRMETARGRLDQGIARLRQAAMLEPRGLRAHFALAEELSRLSTNEADNEAQGLLDELAKRAPTNLAVLIERARLAARRKDAQRLSESIDGLGRQSESWTPQAREQFSALQRAAQEGNFDDAQRTTTILRNVLARVPAFGESLRAVRSPAELIAEPFDRFLVLEPVIAVPSPQDTALSFNAEPIGDAPAEPPIAALSVPLNVEGTPAIVTFDSTSVRRIDTLQAQWPFPVKAGAPVRPLPASVAALDWNHDFRTDLVVVGQGGVRLLLQGEDGSFTDATARASAGSPVACDCVGAWAADIEMDGDLDVVVATRDDAPFVLRNNGDGTWRVDHPFSGMSRARSFAWADLDADADPDAAFLDVAGEIHVFMNRQAGQFAQIPRVGGVTGAVAIAIADINADGAFDILAYEASGIVRQLRRVGDMWITRQIAAGQPLTSAAAGTQRLLVVDLDNNGALDIVVSGGGQSRIWLGGSDLELHPLMTAPAGDIFSIADLNNDGRLDLIGTADGRAVRFITRGAAAYHWKTIRLRAQQNAGDQRINAFGVGGEITVRSGLLSQTQVITGAPVHVGLGTRTGVDVTRIVWPNGVPQAEFGTGVDNAIVAEQRLKGSCPWVFGWDGRRMAFVTDFLWRSPLGLRINAQETAGVTQTEDWVRIRGDQLQPREGTYDVRITAELWETHFFDHVSLMVVDHPEASEVFVDERFSPAHPPSLTVHAFHVATPVHAAWDEHGTDVTSLVSAVDGKYLGTFARGAYQGIAREHYVEFDLGREVGTEPLMLVASGWIYPTDSSINVAISQGSQARPSGVSLEAQDRAGRWVVLNKDVGFPAGKNKTMLVDLRGSAGARRFRLRTNLEIYWDRLATTTPIAGPEEQARSTLSTTRLQPSSAELRFHGYSQTISPRGDSPETPIYERLSNTTARWRDLAGYYTRFGNVKELLAAVDDRYVIMNAGDELQLRFAEQPAVKPGWKRDFVLIGDGWEKDGDYNTSFSQTVLPLPSHDRPDYGAIRSSLVLEDDPVYRRHPEDWVNYHTRYVTPDRFMRALRTH
ncbi:MAG TPA: FG-GAP-like repeat-containing protein [Vicinamibacterales bacterium]|nr:FG-GAP-like repeat-containing protein [Vicinamibacterales bacterium]